MAPDDPTPQEAGSSTCHTRGGDGPGKAKRITSTMAFRTYLGQVDAIVLEFANGGLREDDAWQAWEQAKNLMVSYLADNMHVRFERTKEMRAAGEAPPVDDQPSAVPG